MDDIILPINAYPNIEVMCSVATTNVKLSSQSSTINRAMSDENTRRYTKELTITLLIGENIVCHW